MWVTTFSKFRITDLRTVTHCMGYHLNQCATLPSPRYPFALPRPQVGGGANALARRGVHPMKAGTQTLFRDIDPRWCAAAASKVKAAAAVRLRRSRSCGGRERGTGTKACAWSPARRRPPLRPCIGGPGCRRHRRPTSAPSRGRRTGPEAT